MDLMKIDYKDKKQIKSLSDIKKPEFLEKLDDCREFYSECISGDCSIFGIYLNTSPSSPQKKIYSELVSILQSQDLFEFESLNDEMNTSLIISSEQNSDDFFFTILDYKTIFQKEMNVNKKSFLSDDPLPVIINLKTIFGIERSYLENGLAGAVISRFEEKCFGIGSIVDSGVLELNHKSHFLVKGNEHVQILGNTEKKRNKGINLEVLKGSIYLPQMRVQTTLENSLINLDMNFIFYIRKGTRLKFYFLMFI